MSDLLWIIPVWLTVGTLMAVCYVVLRKLNWLHIEEARNEPMPPTWFEEDTDSAAARALRQSG